MTYIKLTDTRDINENVNIDSIGTSLDSDNSDLNQNGGGLSSLLGLEWLFGKENNLLLMAFTENNINVALFLIDKTENCVCDETDEFGKTIVHYLAHLSNNKYFSDFLTKLLDKGIISASILNMQDNKGNTPLHYCVMASNDILCDRMISLGARTDIKNNEGSLVTVKNKSECNKEKESVFNKKYDNNKQDTVNTFIINMLDHNHDETSIDLNDTVLIDSESNMNDNKNNEDVNIMDLLSKLHSETSDPIPITTFNLNEDTEVEKDIEDIENIEEVNDQDVKTEELIENLLDTLSNKKEQSGGQDRKSTRLNSSH